MPHLATHAWSSWEEVQCMWVVKSARVRRNSNVIVRTDFSSPCEAEVCAHKGVVEVCNAKQCRPCFSAFPVLLLLSFCMRARKFRDISTAQSMNSARARFKSSPSSQHPTASVRNSRRAAGTGEAGRRLESGDVMKMMMIAESKTHRRLRPRAPCVARTARIPCDA